MQLDIIEEVSKPSKWVSPMVPVLKENGDIRICIDMRRANVAIIRENHPLPTMDQLLPHFKDAKLFSRLDIKNAFHQIEIHPDTRYITTFITSKGLFRYKRLMFGISCAPEMFQKIMERTLIRCEGTVNFIDDIVIFGSNEAEHDQRLQQTLNILKENNVLLNNDKCIYKVNKIVFLGHELSSEGVRPLKKYIDSIQMFRAPSTIEEIQSFLGRYKEVKVTKSVTSNDIIRLLKEIFSRLGYPVTITADNGRQFISQEFRNYLQECGIILHNTIPYWPQQNGEVERQNRSILKRLKISQVERNNWKEDLFYYLMMYNSTPHSVTGKTPSELFYKRQFRDKIPSYIDIENKQEDSEVRDKDALQKEAEKNYSDRKRKAKDHSINEGDKVIVKNFAKENKLTPSFSPDIHTVVKTTNNTGDVVIRNNDTNTQYRRNVVHLKKIEGEWKVVNDAQEGNVPNLNEEPKRICKLKWEWADHIARRTDN
ncbi:unnamed protein product [Parnassius mnemosyne]|uniref:Uncharacterized protein n=1 Tax=Parnassius mnemosyne TaxID=213953 RepID=A0AAV1LRK8_9NEOP